MLRSAPTTWNGSPQAALSVHEKLTDRKFPGLLKFGGPTDQFGREFKGSGNFLERKDSLNIDRDCVVRIPPAAVKRSLKKGNP
jgi:hypothetical protein